MLLQFRVFSFFEVLFGVHRMNPAATPAGHFPTPPRSIHLFQECVDICFSLSFRYWTDTNRSSSLRFWAVGISWYIDPPTKVIFLRASTSTTQPSWTRNSTQIFASQRMVGLAGKYLGLSAHLERIRCRRRMSRMIWFRYWWFCSLMLHGLAFDPWIDGICAGNPWIWLVNPWFQNPNASPPPRSVTWWLAWARRVLVELRKELAETYEAGEEQMLKLAIDEWNDFIYEPPQIKPAMFNPMKCKHMFLGLEYPSPGQILSLECILELEWR